MKIPSRPFLRSFVLPFLLLAGASFLLWLVERQHMNPDGVSYVDMALKAASGDLSGLVNAYWSPLFPALLAVVFRIFGTDFETLYPSVHALQAALLVIGLIPFRGVARELASSVDLPEGHWLRSEWVIFLIYSWMHRMIGLTLLVTPDLLGYVLLWCMVWFGLRWHRSEAVRDGAVFGAFTGAAALTKAFYVPFGALALGLSFLFLRRRWRVVIPAAAFAIVLSLWLVPLREKSPAFPWGAAGPLNRAWSTQKIGTSFIHWHPEDDQNGTPVHTTRKLSSMPPVYEFAEPIRATYAPWFDPAYWFEGVKVRPTASNRWERLRVVFQTAVDVVFYRLYVLLLAGIAALAWWGGWRPRLPRNRRFGWATLLTGGGLAAYMTMGSLPRYWGGFLLLGVLLFFSVWSVSGTEFRRLRWAHAGILILLVFFAIRRFPMNEAIAAWRGGAESPSLRYAREVRGLSAWNPTDNRVGYVGDSFSADFAQLAQLRIVTEIPKKGGPASQFCDLSAEERLQALGRMWDVGIQWVFVDPLVRCSREIVPLSQKDLRLKGRVFRVGDPISSGGASSLR